MTQEAILRMGTAATEAGENKAILRSTDLVVDQIYPGGRRGNAGDDPLVHILGVSNQGGFRHLGRREQPKLIVLTTTMNELHWPDSIDLETGVLTYYGDNRRPGQELHQTRRWGNEMLRDAFARGSNNLDRRHVPPIFVFRNTGNYRDVVFLGLAVPGAIGVRPAESLVATWHQLDGRRFQNYRATFTLLDAGRINRAWISDIQRGAAHTPNAPSAWSAWIEHGQHEPLRASSSQAYRSKAEQFPSSQKDVELINALIGHYEVDPVGFEWCAAEITRMLLPNISSIDVTRPSRDGGRDAVGRYRIGPLGSRVEVEFAMEAKCYSMHNSVGVRQTSRLISRLRHRQFGVMVTTSHVNSQAYKEIVDDGHPILIISANDIVCALRSFGIRNHSDLMEWLQSVDRKAGAAPP